MIMCVDVSVIIPTYNVEKYVEYCLNLVLRQSLKTIEIIVIDDMSTDATVDIVRGIAKVDSRVRIFSTGENSGPGVARNIGLEKATGTYCIFMDADDFYYDSECLSYLVNLSRRHGGVTVCGDKIDFNEKSGQFIPNSTIREKDVCVYSGEMTSIFWYTTFLFNRKILVENAIVFPEVYQFEDPVFLASVLSINQKIFISNRIIYVYRILHKETKFTPDTIRVMISCNKKIIAFLKKDSRIWESIYLSLLRLASKAIFSGTMQERKENLAEITLLFQMFPQQYSCSYSSMHVVGLALLVALSDVFVKILPGKYKKILKNIYLLLRK